jgi:hypothetical protein
VNEQKINIFTASSAPWNCSSLHLEVEKGRGEAENKRDGRRKNVVLARAAVESIVLVSVQSCFCVDHMWSPFSLTVTMSKNSNRTFSFPGSNCSSQLPLVTKTTPFGCDNCQCSVPTQEWHFGCMDRDQSQDDLCVVRSIDIASRLR